MEGSQERFLALKDDRSVESTLKTGKFSVHKGRGYRMLIHTDLKWLIPLSLSCTEHTKKITFGPGKWLCRADRHTCKYSKFCICFCRRCFSDFKVVKYSEVEPFSKSRFLVVLLWFNKLHFIF